VYSTNVVSTYNVLTQAAGRGVTRAVVAGSINRYGLPQSVHEGLIPAYFPIDDGTPVDISDWYSLSKYNDENTSRMVWRHWGMDVITLRFPHVNSADNLMRQVQALTDDPGAGVREAWSYLDVRDAARSIELSLTSPTRGAHAFYLAADHTNSPYPTEDLLDAFAPGVPRLRPFVGRAVPMDLRPAREIIGFQAHHELEIDTRPLPRGTQADRRLAPVDSPAGRPTPTKAGTP
jgi:nucleoside-diphosphate-sugar epimerase